MALKFASRKRAPQVAALLVFGILNRVAVALVPCHSELHPIAQFSYRFAGTNYNDKHPNMLDQTRLDQLLLKPPFWFVR